MVRPGCGCARAPFVPRALREGAGHTVVTVLPYALLIALLIEVAASHPILSHQHECSILTVVHASPEKLGLFLSTFYNSQPPWHTA